MFFIVRIQNNPICYHIDEILALKPYSGLQFLSFFPSFLAHPTFYLLPKKMIEDLPILQTHRIKEYFMEMSLMTGWKTVYFHTAILPVTAEF